MACAHMCMQVASYAFTFPDEDGVPTRMLLPLLDMLNHGNKGTANVQIIEAENGDIYAYTLRDVEAGEEVSQCGSPLGLTSPASCSLMLGVTWRVWQVEKEAIKLSMGCASNGPTCSTAADILILGTQLSACLMLRSCLCRKHLPQHAAPMQHVKFTGVGCPHA